QFLALLQELVGTIFAEKFPSGLFAVQKLEDLDLSAGPDRFELDFLVSADLGDFLFKDLFSSFVRFGTLTSKNLDVNDCSVNPGRDTQRGIPYITGFL